MDSPGLQVSPKLETENLGHCNAIMHKYKVPTTRFYLHNFISYFQCSPTSGELQKIIQVAWLVTPAMCKLWATSDEMINMEALMQEPFQTSVATIENSIQTIFFFLSHWRDMILEAHR